jgi:hypothetical protein
MIYEYYNTNDVMSNVLFVFNDTCLLAEYIADEDWYQCGKTAH